MADSLGEDYPKQQARCRELLQVYRDLPDNVGAFGAAMIEQVLQRADTAVAQGDLVAMIQAYAQMVDCE